jgi:hypothetical protein
MEDRSVLAPYLVIGVPLPFRLSATGLSILEPVRVELLH